MRAIILAAGRGSRMGALTREQPKCLSLLAGRTLLEWEVGALQAAGLKRIAVVTGYHAELLQDARWENFHNPRWAQTNMVVSLQMAQEWLEAEDCLISYSDIVYHPGIIRALADARSDVAIAYDRQWESLWTERFGDPLADAETFRLDPQGRLLSIGEKPASLKEIQGQYMGLLRFTPAGWSRIREALADLAPSRLDSTHMTGLLGLLLARGMDIQAVPVDGRWCEADNANDLALYEKKISAPAKWTHDWR